MENKNKSLLTVGVVVALLFTGCRPARQTQTTNTVAGRNATNATVAISDPQQIALAAKDALFKGLSTRLTDAMSNGGPAAAIEVCGREAPEIAATVGQEYGVTIGRTSLKLRNPDNVPPEWAKALIEKRTGERQFVELPEDRTGALLPIKLKAQCLTCHGPAENIADAVRAKLTEHYPDDEATGFTEGDLRGWFWVEIPARKNSRPEALARKGSVEDSAVEGHDHHVGARGPGRRGGGRRGGGPGMREDMMTLHALFDGRDKITRTIKDLPNGAETLTESKDEQIASLIQDHVPAMEGRVENNHPLPPMRFHPLFVELIKHAKQITMNYDLTDHGLKVTYTSDEPYVVLLIQEHAKLVSRFIENGMEEIHKPYAIPELDSRKPPAAATSETSDETRRDWQALPNRAESPIDNPTTEAKVELGKKLFFDPRISLTGTVSCNSCHNLMEGGDDGRPTSMGIHGRIGPRNAPTVWNSVFQGSQFWDGRAASLEEQAAGPIVARPEMGMPNHDVAMERIKVIPGYVSEFKDVFGADQSVTIDATVKAIAAFERTLITPNSPYDRYVGGQESAMTEQQVRGMKLFASVGCAECHDGPAFNNWEPGMSVAVFEEFPRSADSPLIAKYRLDMDLGRQAVTKNEADRRFFKVPSLRNITLTAPYFHNGEVETLRESVQIMSVTQLDNELRHREIDDIVAFFAALEGDFPEIIMPRIPSRPGWSVLENQTSADSQGASGLKVPQTDP